MQVIDILKALIFLSVYCSEQKDCDNCPFTNSIDFGDYITQWGCLLEKMPKDYKLESISKAISKVNKEMSESEVEE